MGTPKQALVTPVSRPTELYHVRLTHLLPREPGRKRIPFDVISEDSESTRYDQVGESKGRKEKRPEINEVLGELLREITVLKEEVSRMRICGDTASIVTTICGDTVSEVPIGVGRNRGRCSLCYPRVRETYLHEIDPN